MISTNSSLPSKLHTDLFLRITEVRGFPGGSDGKDSAHNVGDQGLIIELRRSPGEGKKGMETHTSILAQRIPWTEETGKSMGSQRAGHK